MQRVQEEWRSEQAGTWRREARYEVTLGKDQHQVCHLGSSTGVNILLKAKTTIIIIVPVLWWRGAPPLMLTASNAEVVFRVPLPPRERPPTRIRRGAHSVPESHGFIAGFALSQ